MDIIHVIHYMISFFILFGSFSNNYSILKTHLYFNIIVILHWLTNNNKCFISEYHYKDNNTGYMQHLISKIFNINNVNPNILNIIGYITVLIPSYFTYKKLYK